MKKQFALTVPTPCHENWNTFTPTQKGKFCGACQKEVIDFTTWSEDEIKHYFRKSAQSTCGRFKQPQLKIYQTETTTKTHSAWAAFVAFLMLLVHEPAQAQTSTITPQEQTDEHKQGSLKTKVPTVRTIKGIVIDEADSLGIPGATVVRKGFADETVTDADGKFELTVRNPMINETLMISFIGYKTTEVVFSPNQQTHNLKIVMTYDLQVLGEIVVGGAVSVRRYSPRGLWWKLKGLFR
jgi:hypothetical protein